MSTQEIDCSTVGVPAGVPGSRLRAWLITIAATAISAYTLDAVATAAGLLLVTTGVMAEAGLPGALALLAASYLVWWLGLRAGLQANWDLLTATGTSTNALSKGAHDLARRHTASDRIRRLAAGAGYLGTELAKEIPYYTGAFGVSFAAAGVSASDAMVFLSGANLGAAIYEYVLARATRALLARRTASFDTDWIPAEYLADYYTCVEPDEIETIRFFVSAIQEARPGQPILFFGAGPTLHHVFLAAPLASEIHLGDYLPANLEEIRRWIDRDPGAHDWKPFVRYTLQCEGIREPTAGQITAREDLTRARITRLIQVDGRVAQPEPDQYSTVISAYCADSATSDHASWTPFMHNIMARVVPGGLFITAALRASRGYVVGGKTFPSASVTEHDLRSVVESELGPVGCLSVRSLTGAPGHGYSGVLLAWAYRPASRVSDECGFAPAEMETIRPAGAPATEPPSSRPGPGGTGLARATARG